MPSGGLGAAAPVAPYIDFVRGIDLPALRGFIARCLFDFSTSWHWIERDAASAEAGGVQQCAQRISCAVMNK